LSHSGVVVSSTVFEGLNSAGCGCDEFPFPEVLALSVPAALAVLACLDFGDDNFLINR
jgi:hypothetical protein